MNIKSFYNTNRDRIMTVLVYILCVLIAVLAVERKDNYETDEIFTYGLSNHQYVDTTEMRVVEGQKYEPAGTAWYDYMVVQPGEGFDYVNVWKNQREDVHPPLYYMLVHTISSFFPERFSRWFAGIVNVVFLVLTLYVVRKIVYNFTRDRKMVFGVSIYFSLCAGIVSALQMFRMYIVAMFFVTLLTWLFICLYKGFGATEGDRTLYLKLIIVSILGALTHYYVIVYLVLICMIYGLLILTEKKIYDFIRLVCCMMASAVGAIIIFPSMLRHFFISDRGKQSVEGLVENSIQKYADDLSDYSEFINDYIFGGVMLYILFILIALILVKRTHIAIPKERIGEALILIVPAVLYFLLISRIAVYNTDRYIHPIYGVTVAAGICIIYFLANTVMQRKAAEVFSLLAVFGMVVGSWFCTGLVSFEAQEDENSINYADCDALYLYKDDELWRIQAGFWKLKDCRSMTFISDDGFDYIYQGDILEDKQLLVIIQDEIEDHDFYLASVAGVCPYLEDYVEIDQDGYATVYYLN